MNIPVRETKWRHHNGNEYTVYDITNEHADPENRDKYPIMISYVGTNGKRWSKTLQDFMAKMTIITIKDESPTFMGSLKTPYVQVQTPGIKPELIVPKFQIVLDRDFVPSSYGIYYFADVKNSDNEDMGEARILEALRSHITNVLINVVGGQGLKTAEIMYGIPVLFNLPTRAFRDEILERGMNYIGRPFPQTGPVVLGSRDVNGEDILDVMVLASFIRYVYLTTKEKEPYYSDLELVEYAYVASRDFMHHCVAKSLVRPNGFDLRKSDNTITLVLQRYRDISRLNNYTLSLTRIHNSFVFDGKDTLKTIGRLYDDATLKGEA